MKGFGNYRLWLPILLSQIAGIVFYMVVTPSALSIYDPETQERSDGWFLKMHAPCDGLTDALVEVAKHLSAVLVLYGRWILPCLLVLWLGFIGARHLADRRPPLPALRARRAVISLLVGLGLMAWGIYMVVYEYGFLPSTIDPYDDHRVLPQPASQPFGLGFIQWRHDYWLMPCLVFVMALQITSSFRTCVRAWRGIRLPRDYRIPARVLGLLTAAMVPIVLIFLNRCSLDYAEFLTTGTGDDNFGGRQHMWRTVACQNYLLSIPGLALFWSAPGLIFSMAWQWLCRKRVHGYDLAPPRHPWLWRMSVQMLLAALFAWSALLLSATHAASMARGALPLSWMPRTTKNLDTQRPIILLDDCKNPEGLAGTRAKFLTEETYRWAPSMDDHLYPADFCDSVRRITGPAYTGALLTAWSTPLHMPSNEASEKRLGELRDTSEVTSSVVKMIEAASSLHGYPQFDERVAHAIRLFADRFGSDRTACLRVEDALQRLRASRPDADEELRIHRVIALAVDARFRAGLEPLPPPTCNPRFGMPEDFIVLNLPWTRALWGSSRSQTRRNIDAVIGTMIEHPDNRYLAPRPFSDNRHDFFRDQYHFLRGDDPVAKRILISALVARCDAERWRSSAFDIQACRLHLALRRYQFEHGGAPPVQLEELVPAYSTNLVYERAMDVFWRQNPPLLTPENFQYRANGTNWVLFADRWQHPPTPETISQVLTNSDFSAWPSDESLWPTNADRRRW